MRDNNSHTYQKDKMLP